MKSLKSLYKLRFCDPSKNFFKIIKKFNIPYGVCEVNKKLGIGDVDYQQTQGEPQLAKASKTKAEFVLSEGLGERILLMGAVMEGASLADINPLVISEVLYGLIKAGLKKEARGLAMEVAINAGL